METENKNQNQHASNSHLHGGHLAFIAGCAVLLIAVTFMKNGFTIRAGTPQIKNSSEVVSYDEAKAVAMKESTQPQDSPLEDTEAQLAMIDPSRSEGSVLGATTDALDEVPPADELYTEEMLKNIKLPYLVESSSENMQAYAEKMSAVEIYFDMPALLARLNSDDPEELSTLPEKFKEIVQVMALMDVPQSAEKYHKFKMMYLTTMGSMAELLTGKKGESDLETVSITWFSILEKLDTLQGELQANYGVTL